MVRSLLPRPERYRGSQGAVLDLWVSGKETGFRCLSRSLAAATPPPGVSSSFFLFSARGHSTRHFWKVSLKARDRGARPISGSARATRGKTNPQEGGQIAQVMARRQEPGASPSEWHPDRWSAWLGSRCGTCWTGLSSSRTRGGRGEGREGEVSQQDSEAGSSHCGRRLARGGVWTPGGDRWLQAQHLQSPAPRSPFSSRRVFSEEQSRESGGAWSHGGPRCFRSRGKHCRGASLCLYCKEQPLRPVRVGPWEKSGLVTVVTREDHGGFVGSRSAWTGWKSSSS